MVALSSPEAVVWAAFLALWRAKSPPEPAAVQVPPEAVPEPEASLLKIEERDPEPDLLKVQQIEPDERDLDNLDADEIATELPRTIAALLILLSRD